MNSKNLTKKVMNIATAMLCTGLLLFASCREEEKDSSKAHDPSQPVVLTSFKPDSGRILEMVLLDGENFGTDTSNIRVYFNSKRAVTLSSTGTRILALVPRLPGDTCVVRVEVGSKQATYPDFFRYRIEASVTNFTGNGNNDLVIGPTPRESQFGVVYLGIDKDDNIYATADNEGGILIKLNEKDNSVMVIARASDGISPRFQLSSHPETGVIMMGAEGGGNRNNFLFCDPMEGWTPKRRFIKDWITNDFPLPENNNSGGERNYETHYHCLYCKTDSFYYTRYTQGQLVRINPKTWIAEVVYMTPQGVAYGMVFHPKRPSELWIAYTEGDGGHAIYTLDITDPEATFTKVGGESYSGFRDGKLSDALFYDMRQIDFDFDGNLFIGDGGNQCIRKIDTETMIVETVIGIPGVSGSKNGKKEEATFFHPHGLVTNSEGIIFVGDHHNNSIRRIAIE
ncbi:MAG: IPT/TIG domain-containing protein [Tannerella sp.]|jgi:hypothetical protein|nr:IPT/TIG domain-containing protein [Tannerella sp.]